jgi:hypothetical protein
MSNSNRKRLKSNRPAQSGLLLRSYPGGLALTVLKKVELQLNQRIAPYEAKP